MKLPDAREAFELWARGPAGYVDDQLARYADGSYQDSITRGHWDIFRHGWEAKPDEKIMLDSAIVETERLIMLCPTGPKRNHLTDANLHLHIARKMKDALLDALKQSVASMRLAELTLINEEASRGNTN